MAVFFFPPQPARLRRVVVVLDAAGLAMFTVTGTLVALRAGVPPVGACLVGMIAAIGKAGNPDIQPGVTIVIGPGTEGIAGEGRIVTAGGLDCHSHFTCPQQLDEALGAGITTLIGGGTGPADGTKATSLTPGAWHLARMFEALDGWPANIALLGKCVASDTPVLAICLVAQLLAEATGGSVRHDVPEIGYAPVRLTAAGRDDPLMSEFVDGTPTFNAHRDFITAGPDAVVLAYSQRAPVHAFRVGTRVYGLQVHPEMDAAQG